MPRLDRWREPAVFHPPISRSAEYPEFSETWNAAPLRPADTDVSFFDTVIRGSRELVLTHDDEGLSLHVIGFCIDAPTATVTVGPLWRILDLDDDDVKQYLALATTEAVPVYPNDERAATKLAALHESLFADGFEVVIGEERTRFRFRARAAYDSSTDATYEESVSVQPADLMISRARAEARLAEFARAQQIVVDLEFAIAELKTEIDKDIRDEGALQGILTRRPALLSLDYRRVVPKFSLGGEYQLDYAAIRTDGRADLIEIEPSNMSLFTKGGQPRSELVHAEQQVLDWLDWLDEHGEYGRSRLPELFAPSGVVVIGRRRDMSEADQRRLRRRNAAWRGTLTIATFDDLLSAAETTLERLTQGFSG